MKILLAGRTGQVGNELSMLLRSLGEVIATDRGTLDVSDADAIVQTVRDLRPDIIVNTTAYNAVDRAQTESGLATLINESAVATFAAEARRLGALFVHYSTDYVFDGSKTSPYVESDEPRPLSVYGQSKLAGERAIAGSGCRYLVFRTSWVYSLQPGNLLGSILAARNARPLRMVDDQYSVPNSALLVASTTVHALKSYDGQCGIFHLAAHGVTTRYRFAKETIRLWGLACVAEPASVNDFPLPWIRPKYSALASSQLRQAFGVRLPTWQEDLENCFRQRTPDARGALPPG